MAKVNLTKTEVVWPGKYDDLGNLIDMPHVSLPFQAIETIGESRAGRESRKAGVQPSLFGVYEGNEGETFAEGWKNKLIWGDNLLVMGSLMDRFAGKIDLVYIDPPFATGADFSFTTEIGESGEDVDKHQSAIEEKAYRDTWGRGYSSYLGMMYQRLGLIRDLLSPRGSVYIHLDWHLVHFVRGILDEILGADSFVNEIIRVKSNPKNFPQPQFGNYHDTILFYSMNRADKTWHPPKQTVSSEQLERDFPLLEESTGRRYKTDPLHAPGIRYGSTGERWKGLLPPAGRHWAYTPDVLDRLELEGAIEWSSTGNPRQKKYADETDGYPYQDIWTEFKDPVRKEYATQKNEKLLDLIIRSSSDPGALVADFFSGSGTTLAAAEKLDRRWIGCDLGRWAVHVTRKRLLEIQHCKPFEVLNLGKYERQYWQGVTFGNSLDKPLSEQSLYEYLAFVLKLYGAQPVTGMAHLHGKKGKSMVHIGAVDAPVTIDEVNNALDECVRVKQPELHVLGWEWEMGLAGPNNDHSKGSPMHEVARNKGIRLVLLQIPREVMEQQAVEKGDVDFFELAYLEAAITQPKKLTAEVSLNDFVIPNTYLIPEDVRTRIQKWSDYIDYWAVDWDFQNDTFMQGWVAYRTRRDRKLPLTTGQHTYAKPGQYRILLKIIDIFGNDTSQSFDIEV